MTEAEQRRENSPLLSDRGVTTIKDTVVSRIAGMAAGEVDGVRMGGNASRSAGGLIDSITGSESNTRGVGVDVGSVEVAVDLTMGIDYGKNILGTVGEVRQKIIERVQDMTGLKVTELNVTIAEVTPPGDGHDRPRTALTTSSTGPEFDTRTMRRREPRGAGDETEPVEAEDRAGGGSPDEDETRRLRSGHEESPGPETAAAEPTDTETSEAETTDAETTDAETADARAADAETGATGEEAAETRAPEAPTSEAPDADADASAAEAPTDETTLTGEPDERAREIEREQEQAAEERRERRRRRREERGDG